MVTVESLHRCNVVYKLSEYYYKRWLDPFLLLFLCELFIIFSKSVKNTFQKIFIYPWVIP